MPVNSVTTRTLYFKTYCAGNVHPVEGWSHSRHASQLPPNKALNRMHKIRKPVSFAGDAGSIVD